MENRKAMTEMEIACRTCNIGDALYAAINGVIDRYQATERVVKQFDNGLVRVEILDRDGLVIGSYTRGSDLARS